MKGMAADAPYIVRQLWSDQLFVYTTENGGYQRPYSVTKVNRIVKEFKPELVNPPKVSDRDGKFWVFDGQHTLEALKKRAGGKRILVTCRVYSGMTWQEEAEAYIQQEGIKTKVTDQQKLLAMYNKGDADIRGMVETARANGMTEYSLDRKTVTRYGPIAHRAWYNAYLDAGEDNFGAAVRIISKAWNGDTDSLVGVIVRGVSLFTKTYNGKADFDKLIKGLSLSTPKKVIASSKNELLSGSSEKRFGKYLVSIYNKQQRNPSKKLDLEEIK